MRSVWKRLSLGEASVQISDGSHNPPPGIEHSNYPMLSSKNIGFDHFDYEAPRYLTKEQFEEENKRTCISDGDVLLTIVGTVGRACCVSEPFTPFTLQRSVAVIKPHKDILLSRFLMYHLAALNNFFEKEAKGVAQKGIYLKQLAKVPIFVPPLSEQERIVAELDLLQGIIDKQKAQLKELDTLAQSIFYDMFGNPVENEKDWQTIALKDAVIEMFLGPFGSALKTECYVSKEDSFCMVYEQKHAIRKTMNVETHYIGKEKFESLKRFEVHSGDFIMSCRGTIGEIYRLPGNAPIGIIHPSLMKIRIKEDVYNPTFFLWLLSRIIKNESTNGNCVQMAITAKELGTRTPILPPLSLQQSFATKIEAIERQKASINASIAETQKLFDYTMDKYFG